MKENRFTKDFNFSPRQLKQSLFLLKPISRKVRYYIFKPEKSKMKKEIKPLKGSKRGKKTSTPKARKPRRSGRKTK